MLTRACRAACVLAALIFVLVANGQSPIHCSLVRADRDQLVISWEAAPGTSYSLERTSSLEEPWQSEGVFVAATNRLSLDLPMGARSRFFRITQNPLRSRSLPDRAPPTGYAYDPRFATYFQNSFEVPQRVTSIHQHLRSRGLMEDLVAIAPLENPGLPIAKVHTPEHIERLHAIPIDRANGATETIGVIADLAVAYVLGAVRDVCENKVRNAFCNIRPPGHHQINTGGPYGYCCYANVAIAARYALERYPDLIKKVMIIDWDFHHGNGTEHFLGRDPDCLFYDTCAGGFYSGGDETRHGLMNSTSGNDGFLREWENEMLPLAKSFKPDLILISAGFDGKKKDLMGGEGLTARGYSQLTRKVMDIAEEYGGGRIVSILEGGYADIGTSPATFEGLAECVENHVRTLMTGSLLPETPFFGRN